VEQVAMSSADHL